MVTPVLDDKLTWNENIVIVTTPNQLCNEYKLGIGGVAYWCETKAANTATTIRINMQQ